MSATATKKPPAKKTSKKKATAKSRRSAKKPTEAADNGRKRQRWILDTEPPRLPSVERVAEAFVTAKRRKAKAVTDFKASQEDLRSIMIKHNIEKYPYDGKIVVLSKSIDGVDVKSAPAGSVEIKGT